MEAKDQNNNEAPSLSYDGIVQNRKKSTISVISQQKTHLSMNQPKNVQQDKNSKKNENHKVLIEDAVTSPKDTLLFVLISVTLLGWSHPLPYNFFSMANEYWMYKFRNTTSNSSDANERTYLQVNFLALSGMITTIPSVLCNFLLTFVAHNFTARTRVMSTLILHSILFCVEVMFVSINTDKWQEKFFIVTMIAMILLICSISFGAVGQYGLIPKLPPKYMKMFLLGGGIANLFNAVMRLLSVAISPSAIGSANIYFGTGSVLLVATTVMVFLALHTKFFKHYTSSDSDKAEVKETKVRTISDMKEVLSYVWPMILLNIFIVAIPSYTISNLVVSEHQGEEGNVWANQYFITICSYVIPSITNIIGRAVYNKLDKNWSMPTLFAVVIGYQVVNTIIVYLSNALPRHHLPVVFKHDWEYALGMGIHGFGTGFIASMTVMKSLSLPPPEKTELALMVLYFANSIFQAALSPMGIVAAKVI